MSRQSGHWRELETNLSYTFLPHIYRQRERNRFFGGERDGGGALVLPQTQMRRDGGRALALERDAPPCSRLTNQLILALTSSILFPSNVQSIHTGYLTIIWMISSCVLCISMSLWWVSSLCLWLAVVKMRQVVRRTRLPQTSAQCATDSVTVCHSVLQCTRVYQSAPHPPPGSTLLLIISFLLQH